MGNRTHCQHHSFTSAWNWVHRVSKKEWVPAMWDTEMILRLLCLRSISSTENWQVTPSAPSNLAVYNSFVCLQKES